MANLENIILTFTEEKKHLHEGGFLLDSGKRIYFKKEKVNYLIGFPGCGKTTFLLE